MGISSRIHQFQQKGRISTMARTNCSAVLSVVHPVCCGLDVHKDSIAACLLFSDEMGQEHKEIREFGTFTDELLALRDWLFEHDCSVVAMESTGIYWRPVHNILESHCTVILVNARHYKNVPGRKTDIGDSQWLAELLRHGLVKGSFIPPKEVRQWRELVMLRRQCVESQSDFRRRVQKLFESANIKIESVVSDLFGVSGRNLMGLLLSMANEEMTMDDIKLCLRGRLTKKALPGIAWDFSLSDLWVKV